MFAKKKSAFLVYKRKTLQGSKDDEVCVTDSAANGSLSSATDGVEFGEGDGELGEGEQDAIERRKEKKSKKRKLNDSQESETGVDTTHKTKKSKKLKAIEKKKRLKIKKTAKQVNNDDSLIRSGKKKKKLIKPKQELREESDCNEEEASSMGPTPASPAQLEVHNVDGREMITSFWSQFNPDDHQDSREAGKELFRLLINPFSLDSFFDNIWEQRPLFLSRHKPRYNEGWFSTKELDRILRENSLEFSVNIDVTSYQDGERYTHNPSGRAVPQIVWDYYKEGCSVRLLNPQTYSQSIWMLTATLQEHFQSFVGANVYLTPAGTQGFAPHSDDIEAFIMQLEGKKHWKLYSPRENSEVLPRYSSPNMREEELGEPILDVTLEPGDLLYFPRGTYHQAESLPDIHSLHITLSTYQKYTWGDVMAKSMSSAMEMALKNDVFFRRGLPVGCLNYMGSHPSCDIEDDDPRKLEFIKKLEGYMERLIHHTVPGVIESAMDLIATENIHSSLPPCLTEGEKACLVDKRGWELKDGEFVDGFDFTTETEVKLIRYNAIRLVTGYEENMLYYNLENSRVFQEKELQGISLDHSEVAVVDRLIASYPNYTKVEDICSGEGCVKDKELALLYMLYSHSIILVHDRSIATQ